VLLTWDDNLHINSMLHVLKFLCLKTKETAVYRPQKLQHW